MITETMIETDAGVKINARILSTYLRGLVGQFYKILPIRESEEQTLSIYMERLRKELLGCYGLFPTLREDTIFLSLINMLQYFTDYPYVGVEEYKREVFNAISVCKRLSEKYGEWGRRV